MASSLRRGVVNVEKIWKHTGQKVLAAGWLPQAQQRRHLNVHEHVSFGLLRGAGVPVPDFYVCHTAAEAGEKTAQLASTDSVVKAQVLTGGRGKGVWKNGFRGGVKLVFTPEEAEEAASKMIGHKLVTKQTGDRGQICNKVLVCERKFPRKEFYVAVMLERAFAGPVIIASNQGGVNIEEVAAVDPGAIHKEPVDIFEGE
ncbi:Succinate--CoA ligase [ADP-forming] subunit beta, mitochondrial [Amphibalanus amphitrite]|uniref:Succinate--CoA ligase [ADP-forming] subunit beta, mitochondrial n=1 Tax=Amphibalanus amphitrite TaxID=1232801 RepID=A0A6A4W2N4_AMPAM|nr:Succinate--CoA ligase [ADP-forming] subunit beta, mitochondrial [Amphibalanus amphitrite]